MPFRREYLHVEVVGVGSLAAIGAKRNESHPENSAFGIGMLGMGVGGGGSVAKIPMEGGASSGVGELNGIGRITAHLGLEAFGYREVVTYYRCLKNLGLCYSV